MWICVSGLIYGGPVCRIRYDKSGTGNLAFNEVFLAVSEIRCFPTHQVPESVLLATPSQHALYPRYAHLRHTSELEKLLVDKDDKMMRRATGRLIHLFDDDRDGLIDETEFHEMLKVCWFGTHNLALTHMHAHMHMYAHVHAFRHKRIMHPRTCRRTNNTQMHVMHRHL